MVHIDTFFFHIWRDNNESVVVNDVLLQKQFTWGWIW